MQRYKQVENTRKQIVINNFLGGMTWALGTTVGFAVIAIMLGLLARNIDFIPFIGQFIARIIEYINAQRSFRVAVNLLQYASSVHFLNLPQ